MSMPSKLKLFVDDSGKPDQSPVQVLAGYLASDEQWEAFKIEWKALMDDAGIEAFHMTEAWRLARPYRKLGPMGRNNLIIQAVECIKRNVKMAFVVSVRNDYFHHYLDIKQDKSHFLGRPYNMVFYSLLTIAYRYVCRYHADKELEIILDEQSEPVKKILSVMGEFRRLTFNEFGDIPVGTPRFASDKDEIPLQAADLLAWLVNRDATNAVKQVDRTKLLEAFLLGEALSMPNELMVWDEARFADASRDLVARLTAAVEEKKAERAKSAPGVSRGSEEPGTG
jgi:hypothetical protein